MNRSAVRISSFALLLATLNACAADQSGNRDESGNDVARTGGGNGSSSNGGSTAHADGGVARDDGATPSSNGDPGNPSSPGADEPPAPARGATVPYWEY